MKLNLLFVLCLGFILGSCAGLKTNQNSADEYENCFTSLEVALTKKDSVICLDLSKQKLTEFPIEILEFKNLEVLILDKNKIDTIPPSISTLKNLVELKVYRNYIRDMGFATTIPSLVKLDLADNFIEKIPDKIDALVNLEYLDLSQNIIGYFPSSLGYLEKLQVIDLTENETNKEEQGAVRNFLPDTEVKFSPPCNCNFIDE